MWKQHHLKPRIHPSTSICCVLEGKKSAIHCRVFHGLHSVKVYEVSVYAELCQTLWRNLGRWRQFDLLLISVSPQFLGCLILAVIRKIFESESRVDSLSECYDGQDVSLSIVYISDLPEVVSTSTLRLFADDSLLYRQVMNQSDSNDFQKDLSALEEWENKW
jgi:hypothetical protein